MARLRQKRRVADNQFIASGLRGCHCEYRPDDLMREAHGDASVFPRLRGRLFIQFHRIDMTSSPVRCASISASRPLPRRYPARA
jgi:hypothetical protein